MTRVPTAALLLALVLAACGDARDGETAFREGRYEDAHAAFVRATEDGNPPPRLLANRAIAALAAGETPDAAETVTRLEESGADLHGLVDFLRGSVAYARGEVAAAQAATPEAEPFAFDVALRFARTALSAWKSAAMSRDSWPEAARDVERAQRLIDRLERLKRERESKSRPDPTPRPRILPQPGPEATPEPERPPEAMTRELGPEQVLALLEKLRKKEEEKRDLRREHRGTRTGEVERDW